MDNTNPKLLENSRLAFIGCGAMAEAIVAGLLRQKLVQPEQIAASHPRQNRRDELGAKYQIETFEHNREAAQAVQNAKTNRENSMIILCVKPQRLNHVLDELRGAIEPAALVASIIAGARIQKIADALDTNRIVRTMPNTPSQIAAGMTAWTATPEVTDNQQSQVKALLGALGREIRVETENQIDMATALSATGPTYIFMVMEALTDAGVHLGFSRHVSQELVNQTLLGSVLYAMESGKHPAELRNQVTSPGGTSAEAIYQMEKGSLRTVLSKAVYAAFNRAVALGEKK